MPQSQAGRTTRDQEILLQPSRAAYTKPSKNPAHLKALSNHQSRKVGVLRDFGFVCILGFRVLGCFWYFRVLGLCGKP